ncbi:hypothetical protein BXY82_0739 [Gelidibacter sediminis]|uniref:Uncharacterized protein n=1 Tax=Gelidibacter sediminis TaxID=1608710 RepID=A0A4R7Q716_9FLAO|nr:hypothetical protein BXY82_0739 [Gelidibacter sediminis]
MEVIEIVNFILNILILMWVLKMIQLPSNNCISAGKSAFFIPIYISIMKKICSFAQTQLWVKNKIRYVNFRFI